MNQQRPSHQRPMPPGDDHFTEIVVAVLAAALGVVAANWLAANLAALVGRQRRLGASFGQSFEALKQMHLHLGDPRQAWAEPFASRLPGPFVYWPAVVLVLTLFGGVGFLGFRWFGGSRRHESPDRRKRLGVEAQPRLAKTADLAPLLASDASPNRFVLGTWDRRLLLMTEAATATAGRRQRGVRGAVAVFGPSQSGKTTGLIRGIEEWIGPAIVSSVKTDLLHRTLERRSATGEVKVFDPLGVSGRPQATWSPLRSSTTLEGALAAAQLLAPAESEANSTDQFWRGQAQQLIAGMLWVAANTRGLTMANIVQWVTRLDKPDDTGPGTLAPLIRVLTEHEDEAIAATAKKVQGHLQGQWKTDPRTSASIYTTARNAIWPWADPGVEASSMGCEITLDWLISGSNTLYLVAPLGDEHRVGAVFAALLADLVRQAFDRYARTNVPIAPGVLLVLDEAANTPLPLLPQWSATIAGAGVQLVTVWQSKGQIDRAYGRDADNLLTNHRSKLLYPSGLSDLATIDYFRSLIGDEHIRSDLDERGAYGSGIARQRDRTPATTIPFLPANVLRQVKVGDALLVHGALPPAWVRTCKGRMQ
jgi:type IV secretion system protein VirD4